MSSPYYPHYKLVDIRNSIHFIDKFTDYDLGTGRSVTNFFGLGQLGVEINDLSDTIERPINVVRQLQTVAGSIYPGKFSPLRAEPKYVESSSIFVLCIKSDQVAFDHLSHSQVQSVRGRSPHFVFPIIRSSCFP